MENEKKKVFKCKCKSEKNEVERRMKRKNGGEMDGGIYIWEEWNWCEKMWMG